MVARQDMCLAAERMLEKGRKVEEQGHILLLLPVMRAALTGSTTEK